MDFKVFLSDALSDLEAIVAYIAPHRPVSAERIGNQLLDAALSLDKLPRRGRVVPEFGQQELREIVFRSFEGIEVERHSRGRHLTCGDASAPATVRVKTALRPRDLQ